MAKSELDHHQADVIQAPAPPTALPPGWACARLGDLGEWRSGGTPSKSRSDFWTGGTIPWVSPKDMKRERLNGTIDTITPEAAEDANLKFIEPGGVLFVVRGMILARAFPVALADKRLVINQDMRALIPAAGIHAEYLLRYLQAQEHPVLHVIKEATHGTLRLDSDILKAWPVLVPPLTEQKRITSKIEGLLSRVTAARERLAKVPTILKRFRQSVLAAACSGRLTADWRGRHLHVEPVERGFARLSAQRRVEYEKAVDASRTNGERAPRKPAFLIEIEEDGIELPPIPDLPESWKLLHMQAAAVTMQYGTSVKADAPADGGVPMLRMGNVQDGRIDLSDLKYMASEAEDVDSFLLDRGDIVFNRTNSPELVGKAAVFDLDEQFVFASYLIRLKCDPRLVRSDYVCNWINSLWGRAWARAVRTDGVSQSNINATKLGGMPLPVPPLEEQEVIQERVCSMFDLADKIEVRVAAGTMRSEKLVQSVLAKAFRGDLVQTEAELAESEGRKFENAEQLLERVRGSRRSETEIERRSTGQPGATHGGNGQVQSSIDSPETPPHRRPRRRRNR